MLAIVILILAGLVLFTGALHNIPGAGASPERPAGWLGPFEVALGVIALVVDLVELLSLEGILLILAGLVLAVTALRSIPSAGASHRRLGSGLARFRYVFGVLLLVVAVMDLLMPLFGSLGGGHLR